MTEFFNSIGKWFVDNRESIIAFISSASFVSIIGLLTTMIRNRKDTRKNTEISSKLGTGLDNFVEIKKDVTDKVEKMSEKVDKIQKEFTDKVGLMTDSIDQIVNKVNSMLEVQSVAYNYSIKDDKVRNAINELLTNAKFYSTQMRAELLLQIEELKAQIEETAKAQIDKAEDTLKNAKQKMSVQEDVVLRG